MNKERKKERKKDRNKEDSDMQFYIYITTLHFKGAFICEHLFTLSLNFAAGKIGDF